MARKAATKLIEELIRELRRRKFDYAAIRNYFEHVLTRMMFEEEYGERLKDQG